MNIIYFTMKKLNENRAFLAMLGFLFVFSCSKDKKEGNGNGDGNGDVTKYTLTITKPTGGKLVSKPGNIDCGSKGGDCEAEFDKDTEVTLTATADTGYILGDWQGACDKTEATESTCKLSMDANKSAGRAFSAIDTDGDEVPDVDDVDDNNNGLIEIHDLDMFNHIQYNLAGTSYKTGADAEDNRKGAPEDATDDCTTATESFYLCGYELAKDLDFAEGASYAGGSVNADWRPDDSDTSVATNGGFTGPNNFAGIFEGNGHSISNLYSRGGGHRGLFRATTSASSIRNLGVVDANLYGSSGRQGIGALVGYNRGNITASSVTGGTVNNGSGAFSLTGGLVGQNSGSTITASSVTDSTINGGSHTNATTVGGLVGLMRTGTNTITASYVKDSTVNSNDSHHVGGLVGTMHQGTNTITASYATGTVNGGAGANDVGGLVGDMNTGTNSIMASYATGAVNGDAGVDHVGGLVGSLGGSIGTNTIIAGYATGTVNGDAGDDHVGGLAGSMSLGTNSITASYATGAANGNVGSSDVVGALVGTVSTLGTNTITHSYAFGATADVDTAGNDGTAHPAGLTGSGAAKANTLTDPSGSDNTDAAAVWDQTGSKTKDAWDFGSNTQAPALKYADYDGDGADFSCDMFPAKIPGTDTALVCGTTLLPRQGR